MDVFDIALISRGNGRQYTPTKSAEGFLLVILHNYDSKIKSYLLKLSNLQLTISNGTQFSFVIMFLVEVAPDLNCCF